MSNEIDHNNFIPNPGDKFWYIKEAVENNLPTLKFVWSRFDPNSSKHKDLIVHNNCYQSKQQAIESLL